MIVKIKSHKRAAFQRILEYMMNDKDRIADESGKTFLITHNLRGKTIADWVQQYQKNELMRTNKRKDSVRLTHEIISWHRKDAKHITIQKLESMAREYIKRRNPNGIYVIVPHFDKEHCHVHVCASGVEYQTGKSLRLSKADLLKLKKGLQGYQKEKFPELTNSLENHGAGKRGMLSDKEYQLKLRTGRETDKEQIQKILQTCYTNGKSKASIIKLLHNKNVKTYDRGGKTVGIMFNGQKFRFSRLQFTNEKLEELEKEASRGKQLNKLREGEIRIRRNIER